MTTKPFISVVIPTYQRNDDLARCLENLAPGFQTLPAENYEVIVSDDGRAITAEQMIAREYPWAHWTQGPANGIGSNRNNGATRGAGTWLAFIDSDTVPDKGCLQAYFDAAQAKPGAIAFEGAIHGSGDLRKQWHRCPLNTHGGLFWTANVAIRADVFQGINGFDSAFVGYHEDQDIYERLKQIQPVGFLANAIVVHPARKTSFRREAGQILRRMRDWVYYVKRHGARIGQPNLASALKYGLIFRARAVVRAARLGHFEDALHELIHLVILPVFLPYYYARIQPAPTPRFRPSPEPARQQHSPAQS